MGIIIEKKPIGRYVALILLAVSAIVFVKFKSDNLKKAQVEAEEVGGSNKSSGHPTIQPLVGNWKPKIQRIRLPSYQVVDMTDDGAFLLLKSDDAETKSQTFTVITGKESYQIDRASSQDSLALDVQGNPITVSRTLYWTQRYGNKLWTVSDCFGIRRSMKDGSILDVTDAGVVLKHAANYKVIFPKTLGETGEKRNVSIVEHGDDDTIWIYESSAVSSKRLVSRLIRWNQGKTEEIQLPFDGAIVQSIAQTGDNVFGTFSSPTRNEPMRSYHWVLGKWVELPIPSGYSYSNVKTVTRDGLAIGFVRNSELRSFPIAWNGDECAMLESLPEWPKLKNGSQIIASARNGNVYVQPFIETVPADPRVEPMDLKRNSYVLTLSK